ncbi:unnamed protein product [Amoebophrya sp. A120]|nr:unnamed protein product [Amoebophrya sp. A120]|eukprot:GSA120T00005130001.1
MTSASSSTSENGCSSRFLRTLGLSVAVSMPVLWYLRSRYHASSSTSTSSKKKSRSRSRSKNPKQEETAAKRRNKLRQSEKPKEKLPSDGPLLRVHLWHGSQTGTAEEYTETLAADLASALVKQGFPASKFFSIQTKSLEDCEDFEREFDFQDDDEEDDSTATGSDYEHQGSGAGGRAGPVDGVPPMSSSNKKEAEICVDGEQTTSRRTREHLPLHIFLVSTYGEGDPAQSSEDFYDKLTEMIDGRAQNVFRKLQAAVIGFGNSTYVHFNGAAKTLIERLTKLEGTFFCSESYLDDATDLDEQWAPAAANVINAIKRMTVEFLQTRTDVRKCWVLPNDSTFGGATGAMTGETKKVEFLTESEWASILKGVEKNEASASPAEMRARFCPLAGKLQKDSPPAPASSSSKEVPRDIAATALFGRKTVKVTRQDRQSQVVDYGAAAPFDKKVSRGSTEVLVEWPEAYMAGINGVLAHNIDVLPDNDKTDVAAFLAYFQVTHYDNMRWVWTGAAAGGNSTEENNSTSSTAPTTLSVPFPSGLSLAQIFGQYLDLRRFPKLSEVRKFVSFAKDSDAEKLLQAVCTDEHLAQFRDARLSFAAFWQVFLQDSVQITLGEFFQICPRMKPRIFTGSSSRVCDKHHLAMLLSAVHETSHAKLDLKLVKKLVATNDKEKRLDEKLLKSLATTYSGQYFGQCSDHLSVAEVGSVLSLKVNPPTLHFPENPKIPLVLISAGTGLAPFKGFLDQEQVLKSKRDILLFFGCRSREEDFLYRDYFIKLAPEYGAEKGGPHQQQNKRGDQHPSAAMNGEDAAVAVADRSGDAQNQGTRIPRADLPLKNFKLVCAFSRMSKRKVYVQDKMKLHAQELKDLLLSQRGQVLVCGSTHMGQGAREVLTMVLGRAEMQALQDQKRYQEEVWAV